jgi:hypothetical protein
MGREKEEERKGERHWVLILNKVVDVICDSYVTNVVIDSICNSSVTTSNYNL